MGTSGRSRPVRLGGLAAGLLLLGAGQASAQEWPARTIRMIVAFGPGGTADIFARLLAPELSAALKQQIVVENRPGSSGVTGSAAVAAAAADGYTLLMCGSGPHITAPAANPNVGYDPLRDFTHLAMVAGDSYVLAANAASGLRTVADLKASGRRQISTGSPGTGSLGHLLIEQATRKHGLDLVHVPYRSAGDSINDLLGNHIVLAMSPVISTGEQLRAGTVTALGGTAAHDGTAMVLPMNHFTPGTPVEILETEYPVRVRRFNTWTDSGGAGLNRGGIGAVREYELLEDCILTARTANHKEGTWGLAGGMSPPLSRTTIAMPGGETEDLDVLETRQAGKGTVLALWQTGGGGYGDPRTRAPEFVLRDVADGYVSREAAAAHYGVVVREDGTLDAAATAARRGLKA